MNKVYICTVKNIWDGRRWDEGACTKPLPDSVVPPKDYFEEVTDAEDLKELRSQYDPEDEHDTFMALTEMITERKYTGEGMLASDDYHAMKWNDLRSFATKRGIEVLGLKREQIVEMLESQE